MAKKQSIENLSIDGGILCLNFVNTVNDRTLDNPFDYIQTHKNWIAWLEKVEALPVEITSRLNNMESKNEPDIMKQVRHTRNILYRVFLSVARDEPCDANTLDAFNKLLSDALSRVKIIQNPQGLNPDWGLSDEDAELPLRAILKSAYKLIEEAPFGRVKECEMCGWLFLDKSKNNSRRWCSMKACGSIHKARKYYHRKKREDEK